MASPLPCSVSVYYFITQYNKVSLRSKERPLNHSSQYIHLQYGPVPKQYDIILWHLQESNRVESEEFVYIEKAGEEFRALTPPDVSLFSKEELGIIDNVLKTLGSLNAEEISEKSHQEEGYKETSHRDVILYNYALKLSI